jgi:hypothetical protein
MEKLQELYFKVYPEHEMADFHKFTSVLGIGIIITKSHSIMVEEGIKMGIEILKNKFETKFGSNPL